MSRPELLRTPDNRFDALPDFEYSPRYLQVTDADYGDLRMHYIDEGPREGPVVLMLHGEPTWSFAWRHVIRRVVDAGYRAVAPDHIGFGRSDKLALREHYSYQRFVQWMAQFVEALDLEQITLLCQDWGGPIGLSVLHEYPHRFASVVAGNTLLPNGEAPPLGVAPWPGELIENWVATANSAEDLPVAEIVNGVCVQPLTEDVKAAYDAPFPDARYKAAVLVFPGLIPIREEMPGYAENRRVWQTLDRWQKPFVTAFSDSDPTTRDWAQVFRHRIPGANNPLHKVIENAGHFLQEEQGECLGQLVVDVVSRSEA